MLKILSGSDVSSLDSNHTKEKGFSSHVLMEKAALGFVDWWLNRNFSKDVPVAIFCGAGNNGGDGLAIARLLSKHDYRVVVFFCFSPDATLSLDCQKNWDLLPSTIEKVPWGNFQPDDFGVLVDAFLGVGLKGKLREDAKAVISKINSFTGKIISVDIPSGLPSDQSCTNECVRGDVTVTFAFPKLSLMFPEHASFSGELVLVDIGIEEEEYSKYYSDYYYLQEKDVPVFHKKFNRFSHKGDFGKVLLVAGNRGKMGAAILASKSALRCGSGLVTCLVPKTETTAIHCSVPEAMCVFEDLVDISGFDAIGIGPGIGLDQTHLLEKVLTTFKHPIVLDADALTLLSQSPYLFAQLPKGSILTPHLGEFERLFGKCENHLERLKKAKAFCLKHEVNIVIKGANSVLSLSDGRQIFNSSGSKFMATAGMGDVLTGMLTSFLGQGYSPEQAMICGVFQHGLAGELAGEDKLRSTIATDLIEAIPSTFKRLGTS